MPSPCSRHDVGQFGESRLPAKKLSRKRRIRHEFRRVARSARAQAFGDCMARHAAAGFDHFADAVASACPEVDAQALARLEPLQRPQVGVGQIIDVDVVADARAVRRRVVVAEDRDLLRAGRAATWSTIGIRCVSGSWSSPRSPSGLAPAALKYRSAA